METAATQSVENPSRSSWNFQHLTLAIVFGFITQSLFCVCLCNIGEAKGKYGAIMLGLIAFRAVVAYLCRERNRGWVFYTILAYTSAGWIQIISRIVFGSDGW